MSILNIEKKKVFSGPVCIRFISPVLNFFPSTLLTGYKNIFKKQCLCLPVVAAGSDCSSFLDSGASSPQWILGIPVSAVTIWYILSWQGTFSRCTHKGQRMIFFFFFFFFFLFFFLEVSRDDVTKLSRSCRQPWQVLLIALPNRPRCKTQTACLSSCLTA